MFRRMLLCHDGSPLGRKAVARGSELAVLLGARVFVLCIAPATASDASVAAALAGTVCLVDPEAVYRESLAEAIELLHSSGLEASGQLVRGEAIDVIAASVKQLAIDLVVVGHYPKSTAGRWWSGSQRAALAEHVNCSVLIAIGE
jgi:nucleotide-binding universal stress UspA family protein